MFRKLTQPTRLRTVRQMAQAPNLWTSNALTLNTTTHGFTVSGLLNGLQDQS